jgi:chromosome segregation ATPase
MNDKSKDIDSLHSIKPGKDEVASYQRIQGRVDRRVNAPRQNNFNGMLVFVIVLMAIMMGIGGYSLYEVQKKLERANTLAAKGQENVIELERRLNATGTDVSKTLVSIDNQLKINVDEIRKLWDVSNKRNKKWIQDNQLAISANKSNTQQVLNNNSELTRQLGVVVSSFEKLNKEIRAMQQGMLNDNEELITQMSFVRGQVQDQVIGMKGVNRQLTSLIGEQKSIQEAIEAIDEHRRQLNKKLSDLNSQVRQLQGGSSVIDGG